jgi:DNA invertase Pin-like site-specific DNA recombinase
MNTKTQRIARLAADPDTRGERSGFDWAVRRTSDGEEKELVVAELSGVSTSVTDLSDLLEWFFRSEARRVSATPGLDTAEQGGRLVASAIIDVSSWQRERLSRRIAWMRAEAMTLDMIADQLNEEGVPTNSGEARWHPASVQAATGDWAP